MPVITISKQEQEISSIFYEMLEIFEKATKISLSTYDITNNLVYYG